MPIKIKTIRVSELRSGSNFSNKSLALEAEVPDGEDWRKTEDELRAICIERLEGKDLREENAKLWGQIYELRDENRRLLYRMEEAGKLIGSVPIDAKPTQESDDTEAPW